jgi:hypothetical protein
MSTVKFNKWENVDGTENYKCRAWVNFDGTTTTPTIRASGNVSSVVRNANADYTVNFSTAMPDANYSSQVAGNYQYGVRTVTPQIYTTGGFAEAAPTTTSFRFTMMAGTLVNIKYVCAAVFR